MRIFIPILVTLLVISSVLLGCGGERLSVHRVDDPVMRVAASNASYEMRQAADRVCDGTADEVQILAAIADLPSAGGVVELSEGDFYLANSIIMVQKVWLRASGYTTVVYMGDGLNRDAIKCDTATQFNIRISDMKLNGGTNSTGNGINFTDMKEVRIENVQVKSFASSGIYALGTGGDSNGAWIENVVATTNTLNGFHLQNVYGAGLQDCYALLNLNHGYHFQSSGETHVNGCKADQNTQKGINIYACYGMTVDGCSHIGDNGNDGIQLAGGSYDNTISNNYIVDNNQNAGEAGIDLVESATANNTIIGNRCGDTQGGAATQVYGIRVASSASPNNLIIGNDLLGNKTSSATIVAGNYAMNNVGYTTEYWGTTTVLTDSLSYQQADGNSKYMHEYYLPAFNASAGGSGATWTAPTVQTLGGYRLDADTEYLYFNTHVEADWDGTLTPTMEISYETNTNTGATTTATVEFDVVFKWKSATDLTTTTNTATATQIVGNTVAGKMFECEMAPDLVGLTAADVFSMRLNLNTTLSEIDDVIFVFAEFKYPTTKPAPEAS